MGFGTKAKLRYTDEIPVFVTVDIIERARVQVSGHLSR